MPEQWEIDDAIRHIRLAKYLLSRADDKGMTHGEKHHLHEVAGMELLQALSKLGRYDGMERNMDAEIANLVREPRF